MDFCHSLGEHFATYYLYYIGLYIWASFWARAKGVRVRVRVRGDIRDGRGWGRGKLGLWIFLGIWVKVTSILMLWFDTKCKFTYFNVFYSLLYQFGYQFCQICIIFMMIQKNKTK